MNCTKNKRIHSFEHVFTDSSAVLVNATVIISSRSIPVQSIFGWTILMRKIAGLSNTWALPWISYRNGFGSVGDDNYWLGLETVSQLTSSSKHRLRIEMLQQSTGSWVSVEYWSFSIGNEAKNYTLNVNGLVFF